MAERFKAHACPATDINIKCRRDAAIGGRKLYMYFVYILQSQKHYRYYIGSCEDVNERLNRHNSGRVFITKSGRPWVVVYKESFQTRSEAVKRERQIKSFKGGNAFKKLIFE